MTDLDDAMAAVPEPIRTAIDAELETEVRELRDALADYSEGIAPPETESRRYWDFEFPFVAFDGGMDALSRENRELLDRHEKGITSEQREQAVANLRLLATAYAHYLGGQAMLETPNFEIFDEPYGSDGYYLTVNAPQPDGDGAWRVEFGRWEPDDPEDEECGSATGQTMLSCARSGPPTATEITDPLNRSTKQPEQLAVWAGAPVGAVLAGTTFIVTERHTV